MVKIKAKKGYKGELELRQIIQKTIKIMSSNANKKDLEKRCRQLQKEREEMWERLGMNWRKGVCSPNPKDIWDKTSFKL